MPLSYFDDMYEEPDPWGYETSWYEQRKYALTLASLPRPHYRRAFEPGCSIGVLTDLLAPRVEVLVAADFHGGVLKAARRRTASHPRVEVRRLEVPEQWPHGRFDLIVLSEMAYYLDEGAHRTLMDRVAESIDPEGDIVLVHWRGPTNYPQSGDAVHERWATDDRFEGVTSYREADFCLDVVRRPG